jgi:hypothetical protein
MVRFKYLKIGVKVSYLWVFVYLNLGFYQTIRGLHDPNQLLVRIGLSLSIEGTTWNKSVYHRRTDALSQTWEYVVEPIASECDFMSQ